MTRTQSITLTRRDLARFFGKVRVNQGTGCWEWTGCIQRGGYSRFGMDGVDYGHRVSHRAFVGAIPVGTEIDHLCMVKHCVNPAHLEAVSSTVNKHRRFVAGPPRRRPPLKTHCLRGHVLDSPNSYVRRDTGKRECLTCRRYRSREWMRLHGHRSAA